MRANRHLAKKMPKTVAELEEIVEFVIKEEISDEDKRQCHLCLNIGRRMQDLGDLALLYRKLLFENNYQNTTIPSSMFELPACWECLAELRRVRRFQEKVRRANAAFDSGQNNNFGDFSNLSVVLIHEPISCVEPQATSTEDCAQNIKEEVCEEDVEESETLDSLDYKQEPVSPKMKSGCEEAETELHIEVAKDSTLQIETQSNAAVKRKVIESKTPQSEPKRSRTEQSLEDKPTGATTSLEGADTKTMEGLNCDSIFGKVKIEFDELQRTLKERRNNESFKNMKYKCDTCVLGFSNYICLQEHHTNLHDEVVGRFSCTVCDRRFVDEGQLSSHYRTHFVKFVCKLCNFECHTRTGRMTHFRKHKDSLETGDAKSVLRKMTSGRSRINRPRCRRCVNCSLHLAPNLRRRRIEELDEQLLTILRSWVTPTTVSSDDILCIECFVLLQKRQLSITTSSQEEVSPALGHRSVCFACGISIASRRTHKVLQDSPQRMFILRWTPAHHVRNLNRVCRACWEAATRSIQK